jgi:hypothetical protein
MTSFPRILATALAAASAAAPAAAQYPYPYPQQPYPPGYPYQQPYGGNVVDQLLNQLLGGYNVNDRTAIRSCARAAIGRAQAQYRGYGYNQGFAAPMMRVTAITDVERRTFGLRVRGLIDTGYGYNRNYNQGYAGGDLKFRCTVDYRGYVSDVRVDRNDDYRRY